MKPWDETWTYDKLPYPLGPFDGEELTVAAVHPDDEWVQRAKLTAEAPAMWRLLAKHEWVGREGNCQSCDAGIGGAHYPSCEWLRIAKAIGYRT